MDDVRIAKNEIMFRRVNEAIEPDDAGPGEQLRFLCECGRLGCTERIALDIAQYEAVRRGFNRFVVLPGHEMGPDLVLEDHGTYVVVAKVGEAADVVAEDDPRGDVLGA